MQAEPGVGGRRSSVDDAKVIMKSGAGSKCVLINLIVSHNFVSDTFNLQRATINSPLITVGRAGEEMGDGEEYGMAQPPTNRPQSRQRRRSQESNPPDREDSFAGADTGARTKRARQQKD